VVVPPSRRRRSALRRVVYSLVLLAGGFALAVFGLALYGYVKFTGPGPLASDTTFQVERGGGVLGIAAELEKAGIISSANIFAAAAMVTGDRGKLKPGEYRFTQAMSMRDVMALIVSGKFITYKVTIPEGWTTAQALARLRENDILTGDISLTPGEGQIMPDTYVFQRGETRDNIVRAMMKASEKLLAELWAGRAEDAPVATPAEALILASIIEKETGVPEERARVASVFANRLRRGMRLQSDPTIIYGITGGKSKLDRPLTRRDIAEATPYNTYQINGLPPGPIANPGRASIAAALAPARTNDLYFVADGSGGHVFAATLEEHRINVRKWREIERQRNRNGEEVPVMDEEGVAPGAAPAVPAPDGAAQVQPDVADIATGETGEQQGDGTPPETQSGAEAGDTAQASAAIPIPRPKPEGVAPFMTARAAEPAPETTAPEPAPETAVADVALDLKPGSVIKGTRRLIPIPVPKPHAP
jgi:UPF0755 protein